MGRRKGSTNKPKNGAAQSSPGLGHNNVLTDEERQSLFLNVHVPAYEAALGAKKEADADLKNTCKKARADLGKNAIGEIKRAIAMRTDKGVGQAKDDLEGIIRIARWVGAEIGTQFDMFGSGMSQGSNAFEDGKRTGLAGDVCKNPHDPSSDAYEEFNKGFHAGQEVLARGIRPTAPAAEPDVRPEFLKQQEAERDAGSAVDDLGKQ